MSSDMILTEGITKEAETSQRGPILSDVSFQVGEGSKCAILGPDGSGKSTLLRILSTLILPSSGRALVGGFDVVADAFKVRRITGYLPATPPMYGDRKFADVLRFWAKVDGLYMGERRRRLQELRELLGFEEFAEKKLVDCTTYEQRVLSLGVALMSNPSVLLLDEPLDDLPSAERSWLASKLEMLGKEGKTILLSSSELAQVQSLCDHTLVMAHGRATKAFQTPRLLKAVGRAGLLKIFVEAESFPDKALSALKEVQGIEDLRVTEMALIVSVEPTKVEPDEIRHLLEEHGTNVTRVKRSDVSLAEVFRSLTGEEEK